MSYWLHPAAAEEHTRQVAYYEDSQVGLGRRYHSEFLKTISRVCADPKISPIVHAPDIRRAIGQPGSNWSAKSDANGVLCLLSRHS